MLQPCCLQNGVQPFSFLQVGDIGCSVFIGQQGRSEAVTTASTIVFACFTYKIYYCSVPFFFWFCLLYAVSTVAEPRRALPLSLLCFRACISRRVPLRRAVVSTSTPVHPVWPMCNDNPRSMSPPRLALALLQGVRCHSWLYMPVLKSDNESGSDADLPPIVVMAHGMGAQKVRGWRRKPPDHHACVWDVLPLVFRRFYFIMIAPGTLELRFR